MVMNTIMQVEYQVEACGATGSANEKCIDAKSISLDMPFGGYLVYGVAHQHAGGNGSALYRKVMKFPLHRLSKIQPSIPINFIRMLTL